MDRTGIKIPNHLFTATVPSLLLTALGWGALQGWLTMLWSGRERVGLAMPLQVGLMEGDPIPHLGAWIYFFPLGILAAGAFLRFHEAHPQAVQGLALRTGSPARWVESLAILVVLYGAVGIAAAMIEHLFFHHFFSGPAHHVVVLIVLLGLSCAGRRRPFLHVTCVRPLGEAGRRLRRRADLVCVILLAILYASWMAYYPLTRFGYQLDSLQTALVTASTLPLGALLGWALLHSSLAGVAARIVEALEARANEVASDARQGRGGLGAALEWASHVGIVALWFGLGRVFWWWSEKTWDPERSTVLLGVDWYFVSVWSAVTAAEAAILPAVALFGGLGVFRILARRTSAARGDEELASPGKR